MDRHGIVPDVLDRKPHLILYVTYPNNVRVDEGNELTPTKVKSKPSVQWSAEEGTFYLVAMIDPDAPSRDQPKYREWHHWLVGNIPGNDISQGETLTDYVGAGPPKSTGLHRYVILLYKQPAGKIIFKERRLGNRCGSRGLFSMRDFAKRYGLGDPVAGNFFQAQWDNYVPTLQRQLDAK